MLVKHCSQEITVTFQKFSAQHERKVIPIDTSFRYLRFRAIGNLEKDGFNGNMDGFPYEHFEDDRPGYGYKSFKGKRAHTEHNSAEGLPGSIGDLPDAYLNAFKYPDGVKKYTSLLGKSNFEKRMEVLHTPDQKNGDIEVLMRIDTALLKTASLTTKARSNLERIVRAIDTGRKLTCSMGTNVQFSVCTSCGNEARFPEDYCDHLRKRKGSITMVAANSFRDLLDKEILRPEWLPKFITSSYDVKEILNGFSNKVVASKNCEINHDLSFFELSVVAIPAFPKAFALEKLASKTENRKDYLRKIATELGPDAVIDLYDIMQENGWISSQCKVR